MDLYHDNILSRRWSSWGTISTGMWWRCSSLPWWKRSCGLSWSTCRVERWPTSSLRQGVDRERDSGAVLPSEIMISSFKTCTATRGRRGHIWWFAAFLSHISDFQKQNKSLLAFLSFLSLPGNTFLDKGLSKIENRGAVPSNVKHLF